MITLFSEVCSAKATSREILNSFQHKSSFRSSHRIDQGSIKKGVLKNSRNSQENTCVRDYFLIKLHASILQLCDKRLWQRCFPVNLAKSLRTPFLQNTSGRVFLKFITPVDKGLFSNSSIL